jgi:hypothetical protein
MYRSRKSKVRSRKRSRSRKSKVVRRRPCKEGQKRSKETGRCRKYVRVVKRSQTKSDCKKKLAKKIKVNMDEYKSGRYSSRGQAVAISYSQIKKQYPWCKRYFSRS